MRWLTLYLVLAGCTKLAPDNPVEEMVEEVIQEITGLDTDLSADDEKI